MVEKNKEKNRRVNSEKVVPDMVINIIKYCEKGKCPESQGKSISN